MWFSHFSFPFGKKQLPFNRFPTVFSALPSRIICILGTQLTLLSDQMITKSNFLFILLVTSSSYESFTSFLVMTATWARKVTVYTAESITFKVLSHDLRAQNRMLQGRLVFWVKCMIWTATWITRLRTSANCHVLSLHTWKVIYCLHGLLTFDYYCETLAINVRKVLFQLSVYAANYSAKDDKVVTKTTITSFSGKHTRHRLSMSCFSIFQTNCVFMTVHDSYCCRQQ